MLVKYKWLSPDGDGTGADTSGAGAAQGNGAGAGGQGTADPEIKRLHDENASWRNKHKQAADEAATLKRQLDEAITKLGASETQFGVEKALLMAAAKTKFNDPGDALRYVDMAAILKLDADKREAAIAEALNKLTTERPYLVQAAPASGGDKKVDTGKVSPGNAAGDKPTLTMEQLKGMSRDEIKARLEEARQVASGKGATK